MNYFHMTSFDRIKSISEIGLTPRNEDNSKLVNDEKIKVFFSEGFEGCIALFIDFDIVYENIKNRKTNLLDEELEKKVMQSKDLFEYLKDGVYLQFDGTNIENERNFENGCTSEIIFPNMLNVCALKNINNNSLTFSRFEIIKYMMSKVKPEEIKYYGSNYYNSPNFDDATNRIQQKVKSYYIIHKKEIEKYNNEYYTLEYIPLNDFVIKYLD